MEPVPSIARFIEDVRMVTPVADEPFAVDWLPNGRTSLVIRVAAAGRGDAFVVGPRTRAKFKRATGHVRATAIRFKPGWASALFGVPAHRLTDQLIPLDELWRAPALTAELVASRTVPAIIDQLSRAVAIRPSRDLASAQLARRAAQLLETESRVAPVAHRLGVTARHLHRAVVEAIGVGPKELARGLRLARAIRYAEHSRDWSAIARSAGYYDQAHLIGDFRDLVGLTPSAFLARHANAQSS